MIDRLKIWHLNEGYTPKIGGGEILLSHLARVQKDQGHNVQVVTNLLHNTLAYEEIDGVPIIRLPFYSIVNKRDLRSIKNLQSEMRNMVDTFQPDIIHLHSPRSVAFFFLRVAKKFYGASIYTAQDGTLPTTSGESSLLNQLLEKVDRVTVPSLFTESYYKNTFPKHSPKISCIFNSLPAALVEPTALNPTQPHVLAYGRLVKEKGFDVFLEAISLLHSTHNNWKFTIAGDGIEREALVSQAKDLGIRDVVDFPGWVPPDQVHKLINNCLLVVVPSRWQEPFGLTALQAMQYGRPVVATRVGGLPEVIEQSKTGLIVSPQNAESLADAIERLLTDFDLLQAYGIAASQRAASKFSWVNCVKKYEALYTELNL